MLYVIECYLNASTELAYLLIVGSVERASQHFVCHFNAYETEQTRNAYQCIDLCAVSNTADLDFEIAVNLAGGIVECHCLSVFSGAVARPEVIIVRRALEECIALPYLCHRSMLLRNNRRCSF